MDGPAYGVSNVADAREAPVTSPSGQPVRRVLVIDDNPAIHEDIRKILSPEPVGGSELQASEAALFGDAPGGDKAAPAFQIDCAFQGAEGVTMARRARDDRRPYALAFVDSRMPPGWDGIETIQRLWEEDPDVLIVFCTAYSDYTWQEIRRRLTRPEQLVILKKPFDNIEVLQLADSLSEQWQRARVERQRFQDLERRIAERNRDALVSRSIDAQLAATQSSRGGSAVATVAHGSSIGEGSSPNRGDLERALRDALPEDQLSLRYQPLVDIATRCVVGLEALLRWHHPQLGQISPAVFIPIAEQTGLIEPIGEFVLRSTCAQIVRWQQAQVPIVPVAINLSAVQLENPQLWSNLRRIVQEEGAQPGQIALELTESMLLKNASRHAAALQELRADGFAIELDDFGTGYSSLSRLRHLPLDAIKIDRSFVMHLHTSSTDRAIVAAILAMAHSLGLRVIAEGVETVQQLQVLASHSCELAQGYYFSPPLPASECEQLLVDVAARTSFTDTLRLRKRGADTFLCGPDHPSRMRGTL
jgi:EAL domain-containing protein (putative c-di-GMP-specific phosphodiesterase class I)